MNLSAALDQFEDICLNALSNATVFEKKKKTRKPLKGRLKRLVLEIIFLYVVLPRKINFTQMEKYGMHTEKTYRQAFCTPIDWFYANYSLLMQVSEPTDRLAVAIDPSYISKAGKHTTWAGKFWSGCAGDAKWGLEVLGIAAINIDLHDSFALKAVQTPDTKTLAKAGITLYQWYADVIVKQKQQLHDVSKYIVADAAFSNGTFINGIMPHGFHLVSRLRDDCRIQYLYNGPKVKRRGAPLIYDGIVDKSNIDTSKVDEFSVEGIEGRLFTFIGHHTTLKRNLRIVIWQMPDGKTKVFFSTDTEMSGEDVIAYYRTRFQIEFNYREAKGFTGLCDCQARSKDKLDFAFNASLFALNAAKVFRYKSDRNISMSTFKLLMVNQYLSKRIFSMSGFRPNMKFINQFNQALVEFQLDAC